MHIYLMGFRGSGKSTVGRSLATLLARPFVDTDDQVESISGMSIREIFETEGESGFREREQRVVADVAVSPVATVVSLGGGAILKEENQRVIQSSGHVVWLQASPETLFTRIQNDSLSAIRRPNLSPGGGYAEVAEILASREPVYCKLAKKTVVTDLRATDDIAAEIADWANSVAQ